jgi:uncharacterized protein (DUF1697 family)
VRYAAFLRGINVSNRRAKSADLIACMEELGFEEPAVFRASGNLVFEAGRGAGAEKVAAKLEKALRKSLGFEVPVFLRSARQVSAIAAHQPFPAKHLNAAQGKLQVALLAGKPSAAAKERTLALATEKDLLAIRGAELYWLPSGGTQGSELGMKGIDDAIGPMTMRTKGTIEAIVEKYFG